MWAQRRRGPTREERGPHDHNPIPCSKMGNEASSFATHHAAATPGADKNGACAGAPGPGVTVMAVPVAPCASWSSTIAAFCALAIVAFVANDVIELLAAKFEERNRRVSMRQLLARHDINLLVAARKEHLDLTRRIGELARAESLNCDDVLATLESLLGSIFTLDDHRAEGPSVLVLGPLRRLWWSLAYVGDDSWIPRARSLVRDLYVRDAQASFAIWVAKCKEKAKNHQKRDDSGNDSDSSTEGEARGYARVAVPGFGFDFSWAPWPPPSPFPSENDPAFGQLRHEYEREWHAHLKNRLRALHNKLLYDLDDVRFQQ